MSSTAHMASKKKSKTNEGGNKRNRKATDLEKKKKGKKKSSDTVHNLGSKSIHVKHFQYIPIHNVLCQNRTLF
jgi:hypothetical protein